MEVDDEIYQFKVYDSPPWWFQVYDQGRNIRPQFLGRLRNVSEFMISEEINRMSSYMDITINSQELDDNVETIDSLLSFMDRFLTFDDGGEQTGIIVDQQTISTGNSIKGFIDQPIDVGRFLQVESYNNDDKERRIIFAGMVIDWSLDSESKQIRIRLVSLGHLASEEIALITFTASGAVRHLGADINVDGEEGANGLSVGNYDLILVNPVVVIYWLMWFNQYLEFDDTDFGGWIDDPNQPNTDRGVPDNEELSGILANISLNFKTIEDVMADCMEYIPAHWFFRIDYDIEDNRTPEDNPSYRAADGYASPSNRLTPKMRFKKSSTTPDYYLTNGREILDYSLAFSGEEFYSRAIITAQPIGKRLITKMTSPQNSNLRITTAKDRGLPFDGDIATSSPIRVGSRDVITGITWTVGDGLDSIVEPNEDNPHILDVKVPIEDVLEIGIRAEDIDGRFLGGSVTMIPEGSLVTQKFSASADIVGRDTDVNYQNNQLSLGTSGIFGSFVTVVLIMKTLSEPPQYIKPLYADTAQPGAGTIQPEYIGKGGSEKSALSLGIQRTKLVVSEAAPSDNNRSRVEIFGFLIAQSGRELRKTNNPTYTGTLTVRDTSRRKIEDYKLGDTIGLRNFNDIQDNVVGVIAARQIMYRKAVLTINFVPANTKRRLLALENSERVFRSRS